MRYSTIIAMFSLKNLVYFVEILLTLMVEFLVDYKIWITPF
jgi:hypothetical protein